MATLTTLVNFNGQDGENPSGTLVADQQQDLFGFAAGGVNDLLYEVPFSNGSYANLPVAIVTFSSSLNAQGLNPNLTIDSQGDLFGTVEQGGTSGLGSVYEIAKTSTGYSSTPTTIASFDGTDGSYPFAPMIADAEGDLFGMTQTGGTNGDGVVFEIAKMNGSYASTPTVLVNFSLQTGATPSGGLTMDAAGDLFGTTEVAGPGPGGGTVFEIPKSNGSYASTPTILAAFNNVTFSNSDGSQYGLWPGLAMDSAGNLFGMTDEAGPNIGIGVIYELVKTNGTYSSAPTILTTFNAKWAGSIQNGLIVDAAGNIFGTFGAGGVDGDGEAFELVKSNGTYASTPTVLTSFDQMNGSFPDGTLISDDAGNLIGTTTSGGPIASQGTVFELTGTGFQAAPCFAAGTRIATSRGPVTVEELRPGDRVITARGRRAEAEVVWLGYRRINCACHPRPHDVLPARIAPHAFGPGRPHTDLLLSPDHAVFIDGVLIPVRYLLNGASVAQVAAQSVTYWHVELALHDVLLAEGLPCESYLDTGNRSAFTSGDPVVQAHPDFARGVWDAAACAPLVLDGKRLEKARRKLIARLPSLGYHVTEEPELRFFADDEPIEPQVFDDWICLAPPDGTTQLRIASRRAAPADLDPMSADRRSLGVPLISLRLDDRPLPLDHARFAQGWHDAEENLRWTDGDAGLDVTGAQIIELRFAPGLVRYAFPKISNQRRRSKAA